MLAINEIYCGDCLQIMREIGEGSINLIYIDPPFGDNNLDKKFGIKWSADNEQLQWFDQYFGSSVKNINKKHQLAHYLHFMHERLVLMRDLLAENGSIYAHLDWKKGHYIKALMDEIFQEQHFRNEIVWYYTNKIPDIRKKLFTNSTDIILFYARSSGNIFNPLSEPREVPIRVSKMKKVDGKKIYEKDANGKGIYIERNERVIDNVWKIPLLHAQPEITGYPTQKPEALLERIIKASSNEGDLVADFFCGAGTTLAVALKLNRKWIGVDSNLEAVEIARKRIANERKQLKLDFSNR